MLIEDAGLSARTTKALRYGGYYTMDDVLAAAANGSELLLLPEFGAKSMREITDWAAANGKMNPQERRLMQRQLDEMEKRHAILTRDIVALRARLAQ